MPCGLPSPSTAGRTHRSLCGANGPIPACGPLAMPPWKKRCGHINPSPCTFGGCPRPSGLQKSMLGWQKTSVPQSWLKNHSAPCLCSGCPVGGRPTKKLIITTTAASFGRVEAHPRRKNHTPIRKSAHSLDFALQAPIFPTTDPRLSGEFEINHETNFFVCLDQPGRRLGAGCCG